MQYNQAILAAAGEYIGLQEWPGSKHNPQIVAMFGKVGHGWVQDDETPWCAAFVGSILAQLSLPHTGELAARSYQNWGTAVNENTVQPGDVVVLWRNSPSSWQGHVGFFVRFEGDRVVLRGGNQGNAVTDAAYPRSRILAIRRADGVPNATAITNRPTVRRGDTGAAVLEVQTILHRLGYFVGELDGINGDETQAGIVKFQLANDLDPDGIVGNETWPRLVNDPRPRQRRAVTDEKIVKHSRTIAEAEKGKKEVTLAGGLGLGTAVVAQAQEVTATIQQAESLIDAISGLAPSALLIMASAAAIFFAVRAANKVKAQRIEDAKTGANLRV